jgi:hypothetical protein
VIKIDILVPFLIFREKLSDVNFGLFIDDFQQVKEVLFFTFLLIKV